MRSTTLAVFCVMMWLGLTAAMYFPAQGDYDYSSTGGYGYQPAMASQSQFKLPPKVVGVPVPVQSNTGLYALLAVMFLIPFLSSSSSSSSTTTNTSTPGIIVITPPTCC